MPVEIRNLTKQYGEHMIFQKFNMLLEDQTINCILGKSGCGKTTLLNMISGLDKAYEGIITGIKNAKFSYIFQETRLLKWYTVYKNIFFVLQDQQLNDVEERIEKYLKMVGLWAYKDFYPEQLSGGMKQRLSIARAFAFPSDILLMDEPFKGLDPGLKEDLIKEFISIWIQDKRTVFFVTHDIDEVLLLADKIHIIGEQPVKEKCVVSVEMDKENRDINSIELDDIRKKIYLNLKN